MAQRREFSPVMFFSFGMFIIDEIEYTDKSKPPKHNLPGGAGLYALLGARLLSPPLHSRALSWILDAGSDFPVDITNQMSSWDTSTIIRYDTSRLTTRAWNGYGGGRNGSVDVDAEHRAFEYLTPKRRLDVEDLDDRQACGRSYHLVCSPSRCVEVVGKLRRRREELGCGDELVIVWEPIPDLCTPEELYGLRIAAAMVDVVSPNAEELRAFFEVGTEDETACGQDELVGRFMGWDGGCGQQEERNTSKTACIVREGKRGSTLYFPPGRPRLVKTDMTQTESKAQQLKVHLPAYHDASMSSQVVDPTGGGNTYLGALAVAMAYTHPSTSQAVKAQHSTSDTALPKPINMVHNYVSRIFSPVTPAPSDPLPTDLHHHPRPNSLHTLTTSLLTASLSACVAASFSIEQNGIPTLNPSKPDADTVDESWGASTSLSVPQRIGLFLDREGEAIAQQVRALNVS